MQRPPPPPIQMYSMADDRDGWIEANACLRLNEGVEIIETSSACILAVQFFNLTIKHERLCVLSCPAARAARVCRRTATVATAPTAAPFTTRSTTRGRRATGARGTTAATAASPSARATATATATPPPTPSGRPSRWRRPSRRATGTVRHVHTVVNRYADRLQAWGSLTISLLSSKGTYQQDTPFLLSYLQLI